MSWFRDILNAEELFYDVSRNLNISFQLCLIHWIFSWNSEFGGGSGPIVIELSCHTASLNSTRQIVGFLNSYIPISSVLHI